MREIAEIEQALRRAAPHRLVGVVEDALRDHGVLRVELRMADYGLRTLQLVGHVPGAEPSVPIHDSPQGRAFGAQEPYVARESGVLGLHLPVTVRGDRLGVLTAELPPRADVGPLLPGLAQLCEALGHEILVAERDTDLYVLARRATRLTLAAEMQWQLLPGRSCVRPEFALAAHLEPAYAIFGDNYDWSVSDGRLTLTVTNGMGEGIEAALLTNLAINALRNARRAGLPLADQAALADQAVYAQYGGKSFVSVLLLGFDLATGEVEAVDAGSPRLWRQRGQVVEAVGFEAQLPLGMFEDTVYVPERFSVRPGDRLLFGSDGVYAASSPSGESYGDRALARALRGTRLLPPTHVPQAVLRELAVHHGDGPLEDDALVVCLDWHGAASTVAV
ncbi:PP2C family protein-serine/threonine phosphatase [Streptomyces filamentosus]|uniref:Phosphatase n=1 Tax=Streptomyces filamentosus TaxID=67294 RepID=A0A919BZE1_STRFL|nr:PP2C family protein-serine/threonine phosphatase [Streptomyces filamentosus]KAA6210795.1 serine/threonine-protein phosphatase [Streptomyces filamentosus]GHG28089.1 phosphatase [Streptomyces filamentosus]